MEAKSMTRPLSAPSLSPLCEAASESQQQAYRQALEQQGLQPEAAERAAKILQKCHRTQEEQQFIQECWVLLQPMTPQ